jgi:hypothetical protein
VNRIWKSIKGLEIPVALGDLLEVSPICRTPVSKALQYQTKLDLEKNLNPKVFNIEEPMIEPIRRPFTNPLENIDKHSTPAIGKIYAVIGGVKVLAAIDPGADISLIHSDTFRQLGYQADNKGSKLNGFAGSVKTTARIKGLVIDVGGIAVAQDFEILKECPYPVLLGRDWTHKVKAITNWGTGNMMITNHGRQVTVNLYKIGAIPPHKRISENIQLKDQFPDDESVYGEDDEEWEYFYLEKPKMNIVTSNDEWKLLMEDVCNFGVIIPMDSIKSESLVEISWLGDERTETFFDDVAGMKEDCDLGTFLVDAEHEVRMLEKDKELIEFGTAFNEKEKEQCWELVNRFPKLFGESMDEMRRINLDPMKIETGNAEPIKSKPYRVPMHLLVHLKKEIDDLKRLGFIVDCKGPWSAPILLVKKKDGTWRLVVDYRRLNQVAKKDASGLPIIQDLIDRAGQSRIFSKFDCQKGFWQWGIDKESIEKTAFTSPFGSYAFVVCPMGYTNAAQGFHHVIVKIMDDLVTVSLEIIVDDLLLHTLTVSDHLREMETMFKRADAANLVFRPSKTKLGMTEITTWSWVINNNGLRPDPAKVKQLRSIKLPTSVREVRSFIGLVQYYRRLIKNFSAIAAPLTSLMSGVRKTNIILTEKQVKSFNDLRNIVKEDLTICHPNPTKQFYVKSDVGPVAVGGVLFQRDENNMERPVAFTSHKLSKEQQNYGQTKKEMLAVVTVIREWKHYLVGSTLPFLIITDCTAVRDMMKKEDLTGIFARWVSEISDYHYEIVYKPGRLHADADAMSRLILGDTGDGDGVVKVTEDFADEILYSEVFFSEGFETRLEDILVYLLEGIIPELFTEKEKEAFMKKCQKYFVNGGKLFRRRKDDIAQRVIMNKEQADTVLKGLHDSACGGHFGVQNTYKKVAIRYWWPGMGDDIKEWVKRCKPCQFRSRTKYVDSLPVMIAPKIFQKWGGDCIGPLPLSDGFKYIIVWTDYFSKWAVGKAVRNLNAETAAKVLYELVILQHGCPIEIITDRGSEFTAEVVKKLTMQWNCKHRFTSAYNPRANGQAERTNGTLVPVIAKVSYEYNTSWSGLVQDAIFSYNISPSRITECSPFFIKYGIEPILPIEFDLVTAAIVESDDITM